MTIELKPEERLDDLQRNGFKIIQNPGKFCFGMDAVLLSGFRQGESPGEKVLDLGTGTGIIPILLAGKTKGGPSHRSGDPGRECRHGNEEALPYNQLEDRVYYCRQEISRRLGSCFGAWPRLTSSPPIRPI